MAAGAQQLLHTLLDQWRTGHDGELRISCQGGHLKVNLFADLGPWAKQPDVSWPSGWGYRQASKSSPSQARRRERRAAERSAEVTAEKAVAEELLAEKADAEELSAEKAAVEELSARKAAAEEVAAKEFAAKNLAAEKAAAKVLAAEKAAAEVLAAEKAAAAEVLRAENASAENAAAEKAAAAAAAAKAAEEKASKLKAAEEKASTSCLGVSNSCLNCGGNMTPHHQCPELPASNHVPTPSLGRSLPQVPPAPSQCEGLTPPLEVLSPSAARQRPNPSAPYIIKGKVRNLDGSPLVRPKK